MRNSNATILRAVSESLRTAVLPAVTTEAGAQAGHLSLSLINLLLGREQVMPGVMLEKIEAMEALRTRIDAVAGRTEGSRPAPGSHLPFLIDGRFDDLHQRFLREQADLTASAARLVASRVDDGAHGLEIDELLEEVNRLELDLTGSFFASMDPGTPEVIESQPLDGDPSTLASPIESYLLGRAAPGRTPRVLEVKGSGFSMSKKILFVTMQDGDETEELVLRQEKPVRFMEEDCTLVRNEYALMTSAYDLGLPVPEPLWLETGGALGPDFMMMRKLSGSQVGEPMHAFEPLSEDAVMQIAEMLAQLHGPGLEPFGTFLTETAQADIVGMTIKEATLHRIGKWKRYFAEPSQHPSPSTVAMFDWLERNVPDNDGPPVLVHGDFNLHNMLGQDGRITALLDWEWGHAGAALEDLNNVRHHVEQHSDWGRFCQHYQAHGGPVVQMSSRELEYNRCLTNAIFSAAAARLAWHVEQGELRDVASVFGAGGYGYEFQRISLTSALSQ